MISRFKISSLIPLVWSLCLIFPDYLSATEEHKLITDKPGYFSGWIFPDTLLQETKLPDKYIDPNTLVVSDTSGDTLSETIDYFLEPTYGIISWLITPRQKYLVEYRFLPVSVPDSLYNLSYQNILKSDSLSVEDDLILFQPAQFSEGDNFYSRSVLRRSGYLMRGIQVGSGRDVSLESGLRLQLSGNLSQDIQVRALLDDSNIPIQPEGTSKRLEEIDKVYIDLQAPNTRARFGDFDLDFQGGKYGTVKRRLEGAQAEYFNLDVNARAAGAVTRSQFFTNRFQGIDGIQGPYKLTGRNGENPILIEGGSEKVWVDGIQRERGESSDYIINYSRGEITFMPGLNITSESRIEVDFEYSAEIFPRNLYAGRLEATSANERYNIIAEFIQEGEDGDNPIGFEMTSATRRQIAKQGDDDSGEAFVPAADSLGTGEGDYTRIDTTWIDNLHYSIFIYVQPDEEGNPQGSWSVLFSQVGYKQGDYSRIYDPVNGNYSFEWVGPGNGDYLPVRRVPLPERKRIGAFSLNAEPFNWVKINSDMAVSDYDRNTFSSLDDSDNTGFAQNSSVTLKVPSSSSISSLEANVIIRDEQADFTPFARSKDVEYERTWGADSLEENLGESERGLQLTSGLTQWLSLNAGYYSLDRGGRFISDRQDAGINVNTSRIKSNLLFENLASEDKNLVSESDWLRSRGNVSGFLGVWIPGFDYEWEDRNSTILDSVYTGYRYQRLRASWGLSKWKGHSGLASAEKRQREKQEDEKRFEDVYDEDALGLEWTYSPPGSSWRNKVEISHREKRFAQGDSADVTTDLASAQATYSPLNGALVLDARYRLNQTVTNSSALIAYQVPAGEGDYIRVGDEYFYDPEIGNYILRSEPTGESFPTTDLAAAFDIDWSPHRLPGGSGKQDGFGWEDISVVTNLEVSETTKWEKSSDIYLLRLNSFQTDSTINGRLSWRQDLHLFRNSRLFSSRIRYDTEKRLNNLYQTGAERFAFDTWELRTRNRISEQFDLENTGSYKRQLKSLARRSDADRFRFRRISSKVSFRPDTRWTIQLEMRGLLDNQLSETENVNAVGIKPGLIWAVRDKGRISADMEALWVESNLDDWAYELADGRPKGRNGRGNLRAEIRIGEHLTGRAVYTLRLDQGREPVHLARMEMNAFF